MRNIRKMLEKSKGHHVTKVRGQEGKYNVLSGASGNKYRVTLYAKGASCTCDWGKARWIKGDGRSVCSHVLAVYGRRAKETSLQMGVFNTRKEANKLNKKRVYKVGDGVFVSLKKKAKRGAK